MRYVTLILLVIVCFGCNKESKTKRETLSLNGTWQVEATIDSLQPNAFSRSIPVPGLIDLATPEIKNSGYAFMDYKSELSGDPNYAYDYFWYKKVFELQGDERDLSVLKIHKASYGQKVYVNGHYVGKYDFCFTPSFYNIEKYLNYNGKNEIVIRVGAHPFMLPDYIPYGWDVEKAVYFAGIYDDVELISTGYPYIENAQIVPDIYNHKIKVVTYLENDGIDKTSKISFRVCEKGSRKEVASGIIDESLLSSNEKKEICIDIAMDDYTLWSPETPFLYEIEIETAGDKRNFTFGMREFKFDTDSRLAMLNGKPYYLRGTNIAMHRFLEDSLRSDLPWRSSWIDKMHDEFKDMHWNSYRFHVGFAPDPWYDVADEKGFLVQDEYAFWAAHSTPRLRKRQKADVLAKEMEVWMRERWNHPSVVIWDAQNESTTKETGKAINKVRHLDLSNRPWDNGWSKPQSPTDMVESHPYLLVFEEDLTFNRTRDLPAEGILKNSLGRKPYIFNDANTHSPVKGGGYHPNPIIINEYAWIWLSRAGEPTVITDHVWKTFFPDMDTPDKRRDMRGRVVAAMTEYWRSRRDIAGIQHFCALSCDLQKYPGPIVADEWLDLENLVMRPSFKKYVKSAFAPVGLYIDQFDESYSPNHKLSVPVAVFNDLYEKWTGDLVFEILKDGVVQSTYSHKNITVDSMGKIDSSFDVILPATRGNYEMIARLQLGDEKVFSTRLFKIK